MRTAPQGRAVALCGKRHHPPLGQELEARGELDVGDQTRVEPGGQLDLEGQVRIDREHERCGSRAVSDGFKFLEQRRFEVDLDKFVRQPPKACLARGVGAQFDLGAQIGVGLEFDEHVGHRIPARVVDLHEQVVGGTHYDALGDAVWLQRGSRRIDPQPLGVVRIEGQLGATRGGRSGPRG